MSLQKYMTSYVTDLSNKEYALALKEFKELCKKYYSAPVVEMNLNTCWYTRLPKTPAARRDFCRLYLSHSKQDQRFMFRRLHDRALKLLIKHRNES